MIIVGLMVGGCLVLLLIAFIAPRRSQQLQAKEDSAMGDAEQREHTKGSVHEAAAQTLHRSREAMDTTLEAGRNARRQTGRSS